MNIFIKHFFVLFMVSEIPKVSVFGYFPLYIFYNTNFVFSVNITFKYYYFCLKTTSK